MFACFDAGDEFLPVFAAKLDDFALFNNSCKIELEDVKPRKIIAPLKKLLKNVELENADV